MRRIDDGTAAWVKRERRISRETLERLNVGCATVYFGEVQRNLPAVIFPYPDGGFKARAMSQKAFTSKAGMQVTFWGLADVLSGPLTTVYVVEGEFDRCALVEAGVPPDQVLAAPGAQVQVDSTGKKVFSGKLEYVKEALAAGLSQVEQFILCTDQDDPGLALRRELARIFGFGRCGFIDWPDGAKDANHYLQTDGLVALREIVEEGFQPWPADGVFVMREIPDPIQLTRWRPGFESWGNKVFLAPGMLSVVTGHPNHGKTQLWAQIWFQIVKEYDLVACIASFETKPKPHYQKIIRELHARKRYLVDEYGGCTMSKEEIKAADAFIDAHYRWIIHNEERPNLEWLLGQAEIVIKRDGAKIIQIDPWNRLESQRDYRESESDYIGSCLRAMYAFANDFKVHVQVLAHPSKMEGNRRGRMPSLEDIAGSKHWDNMPDQGFVVHRPKLFDANGNPERYAELHHLKARFDGLGYPTKLGLEFDTGVGRYGVCDLQKKPRQVADDELQKLIADEVTKQLAAAGTKQPEGEQATDEQDDSAN